MSSEEEMDVDKFFLPGGILDSGLLNALETPEDSTPSAGRASQGSVDSLGLDPFRGSFLGFLPSEGGHGSPAERHGEVPGRSSLFEDAAAADVNLENLFSAGKQVPPAGQPRRSDRFEPSGPRRSDGPRPAEDGPSANEARSPNFSDLSLEGRNPMAKEFTPGGDSKPRRYRTGSGYDDADRDAEQSASMPLPRFFADEVPGDAEDLDDEADLHLDALPESADMHMPGMALGYEDDRLSDAAPAFVPSQLRTANSSPLLGPATSRGFEGAYVSPPGIISSAAELTTSVLYRAQTTPPSSGGQAVEVGRPSRSSRQRKFHTYERSFSGPSGTGAGSGDGAGAGTATGTATNGRSFRDLPGQGASSPQTPPAFSLRASRASHGKKDPAVAAGAGAAATYVPLSAVNGNSGHSHGIFLAAFDGQPKQAGLRAADDAASHGSGKVVQRNMAFVPLVPSGSHGASQGSAQHLGLAAEANGRLETTATSHATPSRAGGNGKHRHANAAQVVGKAGGKPPSVSKGALAKARSARVPRSQVQPAAPRVSGKSKHRSAKNGVNHQAASAASAQGKTTSQQKRKASNGSASSTPGLHLPVGANPKALASSQSHPPKQVVKTDPVMTPALEAVLADRLGVSREKIRNSDAKTIQMMKKQSRKHKPVPQGPAEKDSPSASATASHAAEPASPLQPKKGSGAAAAAASAAAPGAAAPGAAAGAAAGAGAGAGAATTVQGKVPIRNSEVTSQEKARRYSQRQLASSEGDVKSDTSSEVDEDVKREFDKAAAQATADPAEDDRLPADEDPANGKEGSASTAALRKSRRADVSYAAEAESCTISERRADPLRMLLPRFRGDAGIQAGMMIAIKLKAGLQELRNRGFLLLSHLLACLGVCLGFALAVVMASAMVVSRIHNYALNELIVNYHITICFTFPYFFKYLVQRKMDWAPHWAPVCLWYSFLVQLFCTSAGPDASFSRKSTRRTLVTSAFRVVIPLMFIAEGTAGKTFLLDLTGAEVLLLSLLLSGLKMRCIFSPIFLLCWGVQGVLVALFEAGELAGGVESSSEGFQWRPLLFQYLLFISSLSCLRGIRSLRLVEAMDENSASSFRRQGTETA